MELEQTVSQILEYQLECLELFKTYLKDQESVMIDLRAVII